MILLNKKYGSLKDLEQRMVASHKLSLSTISFNMQRRDIEALNRQFVSCRESLIVNGHINILNNNNKNRNISPLIITL